MKTGSVSGALTTPAVVKAKGATNSVDGRVSLAPLTIKKGQCTNDGTLSCLLNQDCTVGCQTGTCLYPNPDTEGVSTQFDLAPVRLDNHGLGVCQASCN